MSILRKVSRKKAKIRLGLSGVAGGGKTYSALLIAYGICKDWSKVAVIDTENNSADLYEHLGDYNVLPLHAPYAPERYIEAINECESAGMEVIIIDSITHEWDGKGGCLEIVEKLGGRYQDWGKVTPRHQSLVDKILSSKCHIITTVRRKQDYEMSKGIDGKLKVEKAGLKEVTREGWEYELTTNLQIDQNHLATASKDRTGLFAGKPEFIPTVETGEMISEWCDSGADPEVEVLSAIKKLDNVSSKDELMLLKDTLEDYIIKDQRFIKAGNELYKKLDAAEKAKLSKPKKEENVLQ